MYPIPNKCFLTPNLFKSPTSASTNTIKINAIPNQTPPPPPPTPKPLNSNSIHRNKNSPIDKNPLSSIKHVLLLPNNPLHPPPRNLALHPIRLHPPGPQPRPSLLPLPALRNPHRRRSNRFSAGLLLLRAPDQRPHPRLLLLVDQPLPFLDRASGPKRRSQDHRNGDERRRVGGE